MKARLTKMSNNANALRSNVVEGDLVHGPYIEQSLVIVGKSLTPGMTARQISTSMLQEIKVLAPKIYELKTLNSTYKLEILEVEQ